MKEFDLSPDLRTAVLELGLEDRIPLPEARRVADRRVGEKNAVDQLRIILTDLTKEGHIRLMRGHWEADRPEFIPDEDGIELLKDLRWYDFHMSDPGEERLYYVNRTDYETAERGDKHVSPATRYYAPETRRTEGFRVLPEGATSQSGLKCGPYLRYFGGANDEIRVPLKG